MSSASVGTAGVVRPAPARRPRLDEIIFSRPAAILGYGLMIIALYWGWVARDGRDISAGEGLGYALGIAGGSLMALLFLYSARKRARWMRRFGATKYWFRIHMILGIIGPVLILYHCNFSLGSLNSQVALYCTLLVAGSGVLGRYIYAQIHHGLYGHKASLRELTESLSQTTEQLARGDNFIDDVRQQLLDVAKAAIEPPASLVEGVWRPIAMAFSTRLMAVRLNWTVRKRLTARAMTSAVVAQHRDRLQRVTEKFIGDHLASVRRVAQFGFYERLFSLWHVIHVPFFLMMIFSALVHVLAVHMY